jgi:hypothetical protein
MLRLAARFAKLDPAIGRIAHNAKSTDLKARRSEQMASAERWTCALENLTHLRWPKLVAILAGFPEKCTQLPTHPFWPS